MRNPITICPECGEKYARRLKFCPKCGKKNKKRPKRLRKILLAILIVAVVAAIAGRPGTSVDRAARLMEEKTGRDLSAKEVKEEYLAACKTADYDSVERTPDKYKGKLLEIRGEVVQVLEEDYLGMKTLTLRFRSGEWDFQKRDEMWLVKYVRSEEDSARRILEGDKLVVYGECQGLTSYAALLGNKVTLPQIDMAYYETDKGE